MCHSFLALCKGSINGNANVDDNTELMLDGGGCGVVFLHYQCPPLDGSKSQSNGPMDYHEWAVNLVSSDPLALGPEQERSTRTNRKVSGAGGALGSFSTGGETGT